MARFLLCLRGKPGDWDDLSPTAVQELMQKYAAWTEKLRQDHQLGDSHGLGSPSVQLVPQAGGAVRTIDGPYAETKEALTGYFLISAPSLAAAVAVARDCPALTHGESVEVVPAGGD